MGVHGRPGCLAVWRLGVSPAEYRRLEASQQWPSWETYDQICKLFGWPQTFVGGTDVLFDEDADVRASLAALGPGALADIRRVLEGPSTGA